MINESIFAHPDTNESKKRRLLFLQSVIEKLKSICTLNDDGTYDCNTNIDVSGLHIESLLELGMKFNHVQGDFYCYNNSLTSLEGAPTTVGGYFSCQYNILTSLESSPTSVKGSFNCSHNRLTSLQGAPAIVGGNFYCGHNSVKFTKEDVLKVCKVKIRIVTENTVNESIFVEIDEKDSRFTNMTWSTAVENAIYPRIKAYLDEGVNPNTPIELNLMFDGRTEEVPLYYYINSLMSGVGEDIIRLLLEHGADPNWRKGPTYDSMLNMCVNANWPDMVKLLLKHGADPDMVNDINSKTSLMEAAILGYADIVRMLLDAGADPDLKSTQGHTAMDYARGFGHYDIAETIKSHMKTAVNESIFEPADFERIKKQKMYEKLEYAISHNDIAVLKQCLKDGIDPNMVLPDNTTLLGLAVTVDMIGSARVLLDAGADPFKEPYPDHPGYRLVHHANSTGMLTLLMNAEKSRKVKESVFQPAEQERIDRAEVVKKFEHGVLFNNVNESIFQQAGQDDIDERQKHIRWRKAAAGNDIDTIRGLLKKGYDANDMFNNRTALHWAIVNGSIEMVQLLLDAGAKVMDEPISMFKLCKDIHEFVMEQFNKKGSVLDIADVDIPALLDNYKEIYNKLKLAHERQNTTMGVDLLGEAIIVYN